MTVFWQVFVSFFLIFGAAHAQQGKLLERIVAIVNGDPILLSQLREAESFFRAELKRTKQKKIGSKKEFKRNVLDQLINERLLEQEIEQRGISANDATVDGAVQTVMLQNRVKSLEEFKRLLRNEGMSLDDYRKSLKKQIESSRLMNTVIRPRVQITNAEVEDAYRRKISDQPSQWKVSLRMIFKEKPKTSLKRMQELEKEIHGGKNFVHVAQRETEGPGKTEGGYIGTVSPSDLQPELSKVLGKLSPGKISEIIETKQGYYLLQCLEKMQVESPQAKEIKEKIREELTQKETERNFDLFVRGIRDKAQVRILL